jgi:hypothetical protein
MQRTGVPPKPAWKPALPTTSVGWWRLAVGSVGLAALALKLTIAASTFGTDDVHSFIAFAKGVRDYGPVGIYGHDIPIYLYNHGPLTGWMLVLINWLTAHGIAGLPFLLRVPGSVADVFTGLLLFELIRLRRPVREAGLAGLSLMVSPLLISVSGFHGNTDPIMVMFCLLSVYLVVVRGWIFAGGMAFAAAQSIKLPPVVLVPVLTVILWRTGGWQRVVRFALGGATVMAVLWGPVLITQWPGFHQHVLSYGGVQLREWGLPQLFTWLRLPQAWMDFLIGPGRFLLLITAAGLAALLAWRRRSAMVTAVGLALCLFLFLSPAFGVQYLVWPLAGAYLINFWAATAYNIAASLLVLQAYSIWARQHPWHWHEAVAVAFGTREMVFAVITWQALGICALFGLRQLRGRDPAEPAAPARPAEAEQTRAHDLPMVEQAPAVVGS